MTKLNNDKCFFNCKVVTLKGCMTFTISFRWVLS